MKDYLFIGFLSLLMVGALVYAYTETGSPFEARAEKHDQERENDISNLQYSIEDYYRTNYRLPNSLSDLIGKASFSGEYLKDPESGKTYEYKITGKASFQLCADFATDSNENNESQKKIAPLTNSGDAVNPSPYQHPRGNYCFDFSIPTYLLPTPPPQAYYLPQSCETQGTKMIGTGGKGEIGCDVVVSGDIDITQSYCEGQKTLKREYLKKDLYARTGRYYATLKDLDSKEEVKVFVGTTRGEKMECLPSLNTTSD